MSNRSSYSSRSSHRRSHSPADGDEFPGYATPPQSAPYIATIPGGSDSGSVSGLTGAMGQLTLYQPPHSSASRRTYVDGQTHNTRWNNAQMSIPNLNTSIYPAAPGHGSFPFADMSSSLTTMEFYATSRNNPSLPPNSPNYQSHLTHYRQGHSSTQHPGNGMAYPRVAVSPSLFPSSPSNDHTYAEVHRLRRRARQPDIEPNRHHGITESSHTGLPTPSPSPSFQESWEARN